MGENVELIEDQAELTQVRKQASRVRMKSLIAAVLMTLLAVFIG